MDNKVLRGNRRLRCRGQALHSRMDANPIRRQGDGSAGRGQTGWRCRSHLQPVDQASADRRQPLSHHIGIFCWLGNKIYDRKNYKNKTRPGNLRLRVDNGLLEGIIWKRVHVCCCRRRSHSRWHRLPRRRRRRPEAEGADTDEGGSDIVVVGTRRKDRSITDSSVAIDVISPESITTTGYTDVNDALRTLVPAFNAQRLLQEQRTVRRSSARSRCAARRPTTFCC